MIGQLKQNVRLITVFILGVLSSTAAFAGVDIQVTTMLDSVADDGRCSLREAITSANTNTASGISVGECSGSGFDNYIDDIYMPSGLLVLSSSLPVITEPLRLFGQSYATTLINANGLNRVFFAQFDAVIPNSSLEFYDFSVTGALGNTALTVVNAPETRLVRTRWVNNQAGAVQLFSGVGIIINSSFELNHSGLDGGAVRAVGTILSIDHSTFKDNTSDQSGGAISVTGNAPDDRAIFNSSTSTFSGNVANINGGAISLNNNVNAQIANSTLTENSADDDESNDGGGGGVFAGENVRASLFSSIVARNFDRSSLGVLARTPDLHALNIASSEIVSEGYNFIGNNIGSASEFPSSAGAGSQNGNRDIVGSFLAPLNPQLSPIDQNGGITKTHMPVKTNALVSPVIDKGFCLFTSEQRNFILYDSDDGPGRPSDPGDFLRSFDVPEAPELSNSNCDIGAVEYQPNADDQLCFPIKAQNDAIVMICL